MAPVLRLPLLVSMMLLTPVAALGQFTVLSYDYPWDVASSKDPARMSLLSAGIGLPLSFGRVQVNQAVRYRGLSVHENRNWPSELPGDATYREIRLDLGVRFPVSNSWFSSVYVSPVLASDFEGPLQEEDIGYNLALLVDRRQTLGFGLAFRNRMEPRLVPLVLWKTPLGGPWSADVFLPSWATLWRATGAGLDAGLEVRYSALTFHLSKHPTEKITHRLLFAGAVFRRPITGLPLAARATVGVVLVNYLEFGNGAPTREVTDRSGGIFRFSLETLR